MDKAEDNHLSEARTRVASIRLKSLGLSGRVTIDK